MIGHNIFMRRVHLLVALTRVENGKCTQSHRERHRNCCSVMSRRYSSLPCKTAWRETKSLLLHNSPNLQVLQTRTLFQDIQGSVVVKSAENILLSVHDYTGLPWWLSIIVTTLALRTALTFPLACYSQYNLARFEGLKPEMKALSAELLGEVRRATKMYKWEETYARQKYDETMKRLVKELYIRDNCHPFKSNVVFFIQLPLWITFSYALRNLSGAAYFTPEAHTVCTSLKTEGCLWFSDLTMVDPTYVLPLTFVIINLINIQLNTATRKDSPSPTAKRMTNFVRGLTIVMFPIAASMPSCMSLYWSVSSICGLTQNVTLLLPRVRRTVGIPHVPSESPTPFMDVYTSTKQRLARITNRT